MAAAIGLNLDLLDARQRELFSLLGVFPEDADIPVGIVARLWAEGGEPDEFATLDLLAEFYDLSLLLDLDLNRHTIRFHDTTCHFLQDEAKKRGVLAAQHQRPAEAMADLGRDNPAFAGNSAPPSAETVSTTAICQHTSLGQVRGSSSTRCSSIPAGSRPSSPPRTARRRWSLTMSNSARARCSSSSAGRCG